VANGIDPSHQRKIAGSASSERAADSFEVIAREWYETFFATAAESHRSRLIRRLELYVFPYIGGRPIAEVTAPELMKFLSPIHNRDLLHTAHRVRGTCGQIFRYAFATGRCELDPTVSLRGALPPATERHFGLTTDPKKLAEILTAIDGYIGTPTVRLALRLAPLVFVRPATAIDYKTVST
jgi:integrase